MRQQRSRLRAQISPYQAGQFGHDVGFESAFATKVALRIARILERLFQAGSISAIFPSMILATDAVLLDDAYRQIDAAVRTISLQEAQPAAPIAKQHEVLAENADFLGSKGPISQVLARRDGMPVSPHQVPHRGARSHPSQQFVVFFQHGGCVQVIDVSGTPRISCGSSGLSPINLKTDLQST